MLNTKWQFEEKESEVQKTRGYRGYAAGLEGCKGEIKFRNIIPKTQRVAYTQAKLYT